MTTKRAAKKHTIENSFVKLDFEQNFYDFNMHINRLNSDDDELYASEHKKN